MRSDVLLFCEGLRTRQDPISDDSADTFAVRRPRSSNVVTSKSILVWTSLFVPVGAAAQTVLHEHSRDIGVSVLTDAGELVEYSRAFTADSGHVLVPENRSNPASRQLTLPVVRIRATSEPTRTPVYWLSGGPGQSNLRSLRYTTFIDAHDHVMVGYRGVDGSISLDCEEIVEVLSAHEDILSPEVLQAVAEGYRSCADRLTSGGVDLRGYTALEVADDIETARSALGHERIIIVAESFGTRIGYFYALRYPERVERMVMIGANPPGGMIWDPSVMDSMLVRYATLYRADPAMSGQGPDPETAFRTVHRDFPRRWLFLPIHEGTVRASVNAFLFHRGTAAKAFDAYRAAAEGDASGLWIISFVGARIFPDVVNWGDNASKAMSADHDPTVDYMGTLLPPRSLVGAPLGAFLWTPAGRMLWPVGSLPDEYRVSRPCSVESLFLSGSLDFSTPAVNVEQKFLPFFPNAAHVVLSEAGHLVDLWESQPAATDRLLRSFAANGSVDTSLVRYLPMTFSVSMGFPVLAKLALVAVAIGTVLVVVLAWWLLRRLFVRRPVRVPL